jgi:hypothetical protein
MLLRIFGRSAYIATVPPEDRNYDWFALGGEYFLHAGRFRVIYTPKDYRARRAKEITDGSLKPTDCWPERDQSTA